MYLLSKIANFCRASSVFVWINDLLIKLLRILFDYVQSRYPDIEAGKCISVAECLLFKKLTNFGLTWSKISCDWFCSLPVVEEVVGSRLDGFVLGDDFHLQTRDLSLDRRVLASDNLVEGAPLALISIYNKVRVVNKLHKSPLIWTNPT